MPKNTMPKKTDNRGRPDISDVAKQIINNPAVAPAALDRLSAKLKSTDTAPHVIVEARAGTGKTTTLIEGLKRIKGIESKLVPSPQQALVWESMALSAGKAESICFVAFNKAIATELQQKVPAGCEAMTMHSLGYKAVMKAFGRVNVTGFRVQDVISEITEMDIREIRKHHWDMLKATEELVGLCKQNMAEATEEELDRLAAHYDVELNGSRDKVFDLVPKVLEMCKDVSRDNRIDFNDMIWLPVALDLPLTKYDLLLVDEAQDLNRCQQQLALRTGKRLILCGDRFQSIYGFAGADVDSIPRMQETLAGTDRGCVVLPLTVTRRCGKAIVREAQKIVPDFEAFESNPEGSIGSARYKAKGDESGSYHQYVVDGDMILCRCNAPLVSQCFKFIKAGRKANIQGRDIGQGLISTIKKLKARDIADLVAKISDWHDGEVKKASAKRFPDEARLIALQDRKDCLEAFVEDAKTVEEVIDRIDRVFKDESTGGIRLSSVHKAKGLEAHRVFILLVKGASMPHPMAKSPWQMTQENHLIYVAGTRAINELIYVRD